MENGKRKFRNHAGQQNLLSSRPQTPIGILSFSSFPHLSFLACENESTSPRACGKLVKDVLYDKASHQRCFVRERQPYSLGRSLSKFKIWPKSAFFVEKCLPKSVYVFSRPTCKIQKYFIFGPRRGNITVTFAPICRTIICEASNLKRVFLIFFFFVPASL